MVRDHLALAAYLEARAATPFAWGRRANDCVSFAFGAVQALTGYDHLALISDWGSEGEAQGVLEAMGGLAAAVGSVLPAVPAALAQRGDLALVALPGGTEVLMVVEGDTLVGAGPDGATRVKRRAMVQAWSAVT